MKTYQKIFILSLLAVTACNTSTEPSPERPREPQASATTVDGPAQKAEENGASVQKDSVTKGDVTEPSPERPREPQAAPPFVFDWTEEAEVEGFRSGNASVVRHSVEVIGTLPEGALVLEVQLPDGQCRS
ncbi:MAG: hypothetical protein P8K78_08165 [Pirellulales bacterium]|nr:hypothetical protein [Pirellulales bacterium]